MSQTYTLEEVKAHHTEEDCWVHKGNNVLNITPILPYHKNFLKMLLEKAAEGADFEQFFKKHPERAQKKWDNLIVGQLQA